MASDAEQQPSEGQSSCEQVALRSAALSSERFSWFNESGQRLQATDIEDFELKLVQNKESFLAKLDYESCIERNDPTPHELVTHRLAVLFALASAITNKKQREDARSCFVRHLVQPYRELKRQYDATSGSEMEASLRQIEVQVLVRLQCWASWGKNFVRLYKKWKLGGKQKQSNKGTIKNKSAGNEAQLLDDIIDLLGKTAMRIPGNRPFRGFLQKCLDESFMSRSLLPKNVFPAIFDHFEISNPYMPQQQVDTIQFPIKPRGPKAVISAVFPPVKMEETEKFKECILNNTNEYNQPHHALEASKHRKNIQQKEAVTFKLSTSEFLKPNNLIAPASKKRNSLLAGKSGDERSRFVGSHFNSNMSHLHHVKVVQKSGQPRSTKNRDTSKQPSPTGRTLTVSCRDRNVHISDSDLTAMRKRKRSRCFQATTAKSDKAKQLNTLNAMVQETPMPQKKTASRTSQIRSDSNFDTNSARQVVAAARNALLRRRH